MFKQTLRLGGLFAGCLLLSGLIGAGIAHLMPSAGAASTLYLVQNISAMGSFLLPAWWFARSVSDGHAAGFLGCRPTFPAAYLLGLAAFLALMPWINATTTWNETVLQSGQDSPLGLFFKQMSERNEALLQLFLKQTGWGAFGLNLLTLALMPAVCEEFFFRGCLQSFLVSHTRHASTGIWLTAFIFSLLHLDPVGFLPRLFLGALLGYVFAASRSLYPGILLHFLNNASVVVAYYLYGHGLLTRHPDAFSDLWHWWSALPGLALCAVCIGLMYRRRAAHA
ncbi:MAG: CPBP family intramembrane metalloprotease [Bacteroidales bacterium]|nr:CPBP family intramembrane metalloprotease [Bacteroidales bacterium]